MSIINSLYNNNLTKNKTWLNIENLEGQLTIAKQYADICLQHEMKNKWILMVDPEVKSIESLSLNSKINTANILRVNSHKQGLKLNNIKTALKTGNCSAVVLCNSAFKAVEIDQLMRCAEKGNTQCILLNNNPLH